MWSYKSEQIKYKREFAKDVLQIKQILMEPLITILELPLNIKDILLEERLKQMEEERKNFE